MTSLECLNALSAAENGDTQLVLQMVSNQPLLVNFTDTDGYTMLHRAAYNGHLDTCLALIQLGASPYARTNDGWLPIHCASRWNKPDIVDLMTSLDSGLANAKTFGGLTPLHLAASNGSADVLSYLSGRAGVLQNPRNAQNDTPLMLARRHGPYSHILERYAKD